MNKIKISALLLAFVVSVTGCGKNDTSDEKTSSQNEGATSQKEVKDLSADISVEPVAAWSYGAVAITSDGTLVTDAGTKPKEIKGWENVLAVARGDGRTVGLRSDGTVVTDSEDDVSGWEDIIAIDANDRTIIGLKKDGTVLAVGDNEFGQCNVEDWTDIVAISAENLLIASWAFPGTK